MSARIAGMGWVTPLGVEFDETYQRILRGERPAVETLSAPVGGRAYPVLRVPPATVETLGRRPRLRRSSAITYFTAAAGLAALEHAGIEMTPEVAARTAIIFAVADGGVVYTRRFYETIVTQGAQAASPLLFPETVYNAPASHLAAVLGITGMTYTLVGDATVGLAALKYAEQLLASSAVEHCLVVGGEEIDWVLCEAYRESRLAGATLAEGGAALVVSREGPWELRVHPGAPFFRRKEAGAALSRVLGEIDGNPRLVVASANGTWIDAVEETAIAAHFPAAEILRPKRSLGEAVGAGALMQCIVAALARESPGSAVVSCLGFNQQAAGAIITRH